jgi:hypothetical protein
MSYDAVVSGEAYLLDGPSDPRDVASKPGVYTAPSDSPSYGVLRGLVAVGHAHLLGETQTEDGQRAIAVRVSKAKPNAAGAITIGAEFFASAKQDYSNWKEKFWREACQNSVDAGATKVDISVTSLDENQRELPRDMSPEQAATVRYVRVVAEDNGRGMDEEILFGKFLVLGGTAKKSAAGSVGGFGKAKELLLLPWVSWAIYTRDIVVSGHGIQYEQRSSSTIEGTILSVVMAADDATSEAAAISFLKKCNIPQVRFRVNGKEVKANLKPGELIRSLEGKADIYYDKKQKLESPVMLVRVQGIYMFERWISSEVEGTTIVELTGKSTDLLTANRDGLRDYNLERALDTFQNEIAADTKSALKKKKNLVHEIYEGQRFRAEAPRIQSQILYAMGDVDADESKGKRQFLSEGKIDRIVEIVEMMGATGPVDDEGGDGPVILRPLGDALRAMMDIPIMGPKQVELMAQHFAFTPAFLVHNEDDEFRVPTKFRPEKMTPGLRKLARFWAELCRFVLIQLAYDGEFGVGWVFSKDTGAAYLREDNAHWLLLNPFEHPAGTSMMPAFTGGVFNLANEKHVNWLYAAAVHEATHMADGITYHNEAFSTAMTRNVALTANRGRQIEKIRKSIVARGARPGHGVESVL